MTPEDIRSEADLAVRKFAVQLAQDADKATGIPKPFGIEVTETTVPGERIDFQLEPSSKALGGEGGFFVRPAPPSTDPLGACCIGGVCSQLTHTQCLALGGIYHGDGVPCSPSPC